jgi:hypothetical protein
MFVCCSHCADILFYELVMEEFLLLQTLPHREIKPHPTIKINLLIIYTRSTALETLGRGEYRRRHFDGLVRSSTDGILDCLITNKVHCLWCVLYDYAVVNGAYIFMREYSSGLLILPTYLSKFDP